MAMVGNNMANVGQIQIREAELSDLDGMASCHIAAFPERFMTEMGLHWLKGLYRYYIQHNRGLSLVAVDGAGKVLGLAVGGKPGIRGEFLHKAFFRYPHIILWKFFTNSFVCKRLLAELFKKLRINRSASKAAISAQKPRDMANYGSLLSIAVYPEYQGSGIAGQLIESFQKASAEKDYDFLELSVLNDNRRAIGFYKKHGWCEVGKHESSTKFRLALEQRSGSGTTNVVNT